MPLGDIASGCLELVARVILEVVVNGLRESFWPWCQISGAYVTWLITFGRVRLEDRHEVLAGIIGIFLHLGVIAIVIHWIMKTPGVTQ